MVSKTRSCRVVRSVKLPTKFHVGNIHIVCEPAHRMMLGKGSSHTHRCVDPFPMRLRREAAIVEVQIGPHDAQFEHRTLDGPALRVRDPLNLMTPGLFSLLPGKELSGVQL